MIRQYTNQETEDFKSWPGGPSKPEVLTSSIGFNRFTWDFRKTSIPAVKDVFVLGDYTGNRIIPGEYTLRLRSGDQLSETTVSVLANPNIVATTQDYTDQEAFLNEVDSLVTDIHLSVNKMRDAKGQLETYKTRMSSNEAYEPLAEKTDSLILAIEAWEEHLIQPRQKTFQDVINFDNKLNAELMHLKSYVAGNDPRITAGAKARLEDLKTQWTALKQQQEKISGSEFEKFNAMYRSYEVPAIIMND
ncbi:hypothetical protein [Robertkochia flava]|uniref:hypothetical protein n=1 Tax=Robertkochia flava TaxID=3447986 RepID=UPI001CCCCE0F|nr:hypothetical protein [Robertkochia marina]